MKLRQLIQNIPEITVMGSKEIEITGITANSKTVGPGYLFIAKRGLNSDGNNFIPEAINSGCACILTDIFDPSIKKVCQIIHPNVSEIEGALADSFFQHPSSELFMVGVTGTSGKTTISYATWHLLSIFNEKVGLIGTIESIIGDKSYQSTHTTPDVITCHKMLKEMVKADCASAVMEVTSHALHQNRVAFIDFDIAIFTNLSHDHLDYHSSMEDYFSVKSKLFTSLGKNSSKKSFPKTALINADDPYASRIKEITKAKVITYGIENDADLKATNVSFSLEGTTFDLVFEDQKETFSIPLLGRFNVLNIMAAIGVAIIKGIHLKDMVEPLKQFNGAPGRLERIKNPLGLTIFVDYAHKPDALKNVLITLRECGPERIITLFGCGGDRDREKRPIMGKIAEELSSIVIVTSDNPRSEDPMSIINEIFTGFTNPEKHQHEQDRRKAIFLAIEKATSKDIVLIAGKGHETKQHFKRMSTEFDDRLVAIEYFETIEPQ